MCLRRCSLGCAGAPSRDASQMYYRSNPWPAASFPPCFADAQFCKKLGVSEEAYQKFLAGWDGAVPNVPAGGGTACHSAERGAEPSADQALTPGIAAVADRCNYGQGQPLSWQSVPPHEAKQG